MTRTTRFAVALVAAAGGMLATRAARAQVDAGVPSCSSLPNPIYVGGSTAFQPTLGWYAAKLAAETPASTIVYQSQGSCIGAGDIASHTAITGTAIYYLPLATGGTPTTATCSVDANTYLDIGVSDVFYDSCAASNQAPSPKPAAVQDTVGPVQAIEIIVPQNNTTGYLTAGEGNVIWGCGHYTSSDNKVLFGMNGVFVRGTSSGSQIITSGAIQLADLSFFGNSMTTTPLLQVNGSTGMETAVGSFPMKNSGSLNAIGFLGADFYDRDHSTTPGAAFISLPFAAAGQKNAYYVDSEPGARDRQNVRDGHYFAWGYEHLLYSAVTTDGGASQPNAAAAKLIGLITGATHDSTFDYVQLDAVAGTIPLCAMSVQKANDSPGYLAPYAPADTCQCAYVAAASGNVPAGCTPCTAGDAGTSCGSGKSCHHGYCE